MVYCLAPPKVESIPESQATEQGKLWLAAFKQFSERSSVLDLLKAVDHHVNMLTPRESVFTPGEDPLPCSSSPLTQDMIVVTVFTETDEYLRLRQLFHADGKWVIDNGGLSWQSHNSVVLAVDSAVQYAIDTLQEKLKAISSIPICHEQVQIDRPDTRKELYQAAMGLLLKTNQHLGLDDTTTQDEQCTS